MLGICDNPNIKLMVLKVLGGSEGIGKTNSVVDAIKYAENMGASICNLSMGISEDEPILYEAMKNSQMLFVVAAGNGENGTEKGKDSDLFPTYPGAYNLKNIITVGNLQADGNLNYTSNYGDASVDLVAPGTAILSTYPANQYAYMTGTSMATPLVTAVAALLYAGDQRLTLADVKQVILNSVTKLPSLKGLILTGGMLNTKGAIDYNYTSYGKAWGISKVNTGQSPKISFQMSYKDNQKYLLIQISDADDDLLSLRYGKGFLFASDFAKGTLGTGFSYDPYGTLFIIDSNKGGTYTFYALDEWGNESVKRVMVFP